MRTLKIALWAAAALLWVSACQDPNFVSRKDYDSLMQEYESLQEGTRSLREEHAAQAQAVDQILQHLSNISSSTVSLRGDLERGTAQMTQVQQIESGLDRIKDQMAQLEAQTKSNAQLRSMVKSLKKVISEKEAEIASLKEEIARKDATISEQHKTITEQSGTIQNQHATISAQQENLRAILAEQAQMLFQAGADFEELGDNAPEMSLRKNKRKMADFRESMYQKAILYFRQAQQAGYPEAAYRISQIEEKLDE